MVSASTWADRREGPLEAPSTTGREGGATRRPGAPFGPRTWSSGAEPLAVAPWPSPAFRGARPPDGGGFTAPRGARRPLEPGEGQAPPRSRPAPKPPPRRTRASLLTPLLLLLAALLLAAVAPRRCDAQTGGTDIFRIGGFVTGHENSGAAGAGSSFFEQHYGPSFRDYLNKELPGLSFELVPLNGSTVYDAVAREEVDFLFTDPATFVCLSSEFAATFLATRSSLLLRWEVNYIASAIVTRADRHDITKFGDLVNKRVGTSSYRTVPDMVRMGLPSLEGGVSGTRGAPLAGGTGARSFNLSRPFLR